MQTFLKTVMLLALFCFSQQIVAQRRVITGTVISSEDGEPLIGATL